MTKTTKTYPSRWTACGRPDCPRSSAPVDDPRLAFLRDRIATLLDTADLPPAVRDYLGEALDETV